MKYLFTVPPFAISVIGVPQGIGIVATVAKNAGLEVYALVAKIYEPDSVYIERLRYMIREQKIDVVCIGALSTDYPRAKRIIDSASEEGCITVLGGNIVSASPELIATNIGATYCVVGEGEYTFLELAEALESKRCTNDINGLIYKDGNELNTPPPRKVVDNLDTLPFIDGELFQYQKYLERSNTFHWILSRSCPFNCTFCFHAPDSYYRAKSIDYSFSELDYYINQYGKHIKFLNIIDDMFNVNKNRMLEFCRRIKQYGIPFRVQTRLDFIDEECIITLKKAGCVILGVGVESASNKVLRSMNKKLTLHQIKKGFKLAEKHEIIIDAQIIIGDIADDLETIAESEKFFIENFMLHDLQIHMIRVLPGTVLYKYAVRNELIKDELEFLEKDCPFINVSKIPNEIYRFLPYRYKNIMNGKYYMKSVPIDDQTPIFHLHKDGSFDFSAYCMTCYNRIYLKNTTLFSREAGQARGSCPKCGVSQYLLFFESLGIGSFDNDLLISLSEKMFKDYKNKIIVIWGINKRRIKRLLMLSQTLRDCLVKIVDSNYEWIKDQTYCGLSIESPDTLKNIKFDYLIITAEDRKMKSSQRWILWA